MPVTTDVPIQARAAKSAPGYQVQKAVAAGQAGKQMAVYALLDPTQYPDAAKNVGVGVTGRPIAGRLTLYDGSGKAVASVEWDATDPNLFLDHHGNAVPGPSFQVNLSEVAGQTATLEANLYAACNAGLGHEFV